MKKNALVIALLYGQIYLWSGAMFMSILYHLFDFYTETSVTYITEVFYYIMQAFGIFFYAIYLKNNPAAVHKKDFSVAFLLLLFLAGAVSMRSEDAVVVLIFGAVMNIFIGCLTCSFLTRITTDIDAKSRGLTFALSYAVGSIGTWLISLPSGGKALQADYIVYIYVIMAIVSVLCLTFLCDCEISAGAEPPAQAESSASGGKYLLFIFLLPVFFYVILTMGYHFEQEKADEINIVFTRAFYAFGLLAAGYINDKSRKTGAICALLALSFPLVCLALRNDTGFILISSIMSYIFLGFLSVYRVVLFADIASKKTAWTYLSTFGIAGGLLGNSIGTTLGIALEPNQTALACTTLLLYIFCSFLFFIAYDYLYAAQKERPASSEAERQERQFQEYVALHKLNSKQTEVLRLLLNGCSNCEIAENLFIAESTVKYHVKNILKITGNANRNDLIAEYRQSSMRQ